MTTDPMTFLAGITIAFILFFAVAAHFDPTK